MPSPSKPSDFSNLVLTSSATLCDRFKAVLLSLPTQLYNFVNYVLDEDGKPSKTFAVDLTTNTGIWSVGDIKSTAAKGTPDGWLECDGGQADKIKFSALYAEISNTYGDGDGDKTFNVPDMRAHVLIGYNAEEVQLAGYSSFPLGSRKGEEFVQLNEDNLPSHNHVNSAAMGKYVWHDSQTGLSHQRTNHFDSGGSYAGVSTVEQLFQEAGSNNPSGVSVVQPCLAVRFLIYSGVLNSSE